MKYNGNNLKKQNDFRSSVISKNTKSTFVNMQISYFGITFCSFLLQMIFKIH